MKNNIKSFICFSVLLALAACTTNDKEPIASNNGFELRKDDAIISAAVLTTANDTVTFATFNWDESDFGIPTVAKDSLVISDHNADPSFTNAITYKGNGIAVTPDSRVCTLKNTELNALMNKLPSFNCGEMKIDVRIKSTLGIKNGQIQYSNPITFTVTGYSTKLPILTFAMDGENVETAPRLLAQDFTSLSSFEGYFYLIPGSYKFYRPDPCGSFTSPIVYGLTGTATGSLVIDGTNGFIVTTSGHYYITANLSDSGTGSLTYAIKSFNTGTNGFGIFGSATRATGYVNTTPMNYNVDTKKWTVTMDLINGKKFSFKTSSTAAVATLVGSGNGSFSESSLTTFSGTGNPASDGSIKEPGDFVNNNTKTRYTIEVDLSKPRNYTYKLTLAP
jgi:hypothetical protein